MIPYAYRSAERKEDDIAYACDAIQSDKSKRFFCPNKLCDAELHICSMDGSKTPYFRATKKEHGHVEGCIYKAESSYSLGEHYEEAFLFEDAIDALMIGNDDTRKTRKIINKNANGYNKPLSTITQIYHMCKSFSVNHTYAGKKIWEMLLDDRSIGRYSKGCFGKRIIEGRFKSRLYDNNEHIIFIEAPINSCQYTFELHFQSEILYKFVRNQAYDNRQHGVIVAADWSKSDGVNCFRGEIITRKQYKVV